MNRHKKQFNKRRLFVEQIVVFVVLRCGRRNDAMWHMPRNNQMSIIRIIRNVIVVGYVLVRETIIVINGYNS